MTNDRANKTNLNKKSKPFYRLIKKKMTTKGQRINLKRTVDYSQHLKMHWFAKSLKGNKE